jgi:hypothetical protein
MAMVSVVKALKQHEAAGIVGVICGRALYDGAINLAAAVKPAAGVRRSLSTPGPTKIVMLGLDPSIQAASAALRGPGSPGHAPSARPGDDGD